MKIKILIFLVLVLFIFGCSPKVVPVVVAEKEFSKEELVGKNLYENNCAKCHILHDKNKLSAEKWIPVLNKMQGLAKISDSERELIYTYLTSN